MLSQIHVITGYNFYKIICCYKITINITVADMHWHDFKHALYNNLQMALFRTTVAKHTTYTLMQNKTNAQNTYNQLLKQLWKQAHTTHLNTKAQRQCIAVIITYSTGI